MMTIPQSLPSNLATSSRKDSGSFTSKSEGRTASPNVSNSSSARSNSIPTGSTSSSTPNLNSNKPNPSSARSNRSKRGSRSAVSSRSGSVTAQKDRRPSASISSPLPVVHSSNSSIHNAPSALPDHMVNTEEAKSGEFAKLQIPEELKTTFTRQQAIETVQILQERLNYKFKPENLHYTLRALIHPSKIAGGNMVLAQLGDAALRTSLIRHLYLLHPLIPKGVVQDRIDSLLSGYELCTLARNLNISDLLQTATPREKQSQKSMESLLEALAGAIFLDGGMDAVDKWMQTQGFWKGENAVLEKLGLATSPTEDQGSRKEDESTSRESREK